jgi:uncharacterized membrane protein
MKSLILYLLAIILFFLFVGRTTIDGTFPYTHVEYPIRAVVIIVLVVLVGWIGTMIKC